MSEVFGIVNIQGHRMEAVDAMQKESKQVNGKRNSKNSTCAVENPGLYATIFSASS